LDCGGTTPPFLHGEKSDRAGTTKSAFRNGGAKEKRRRAAAVQVRRGPRLFRAILIDAPHLSGDALGQTRPTREPEQMRHSRSCMD